MARRNRKRVTREPRWTFSWPVINWHRLLTGAVALLLVGAAYVSTVWLMNRPIESVVINGSFQRVSAMQLEEALAAHIQTGFFSADLDAIHAEIVGIPWIERATVRRSWPTRIVVTVVEEQPAARWRESGLLNVRGELFVSDATHIPAELPLLSGPAGSEKRVARQYFRIEEGLEQRGLTAVRLSLDPRGAWSFQLNNGVSVRLGDAALEERLARFFAAYDGVISARVEQVDYVDMRYTNGFAIGWKNAAAASGPANPEDGPSV